MGYTYGYPIFDLPQVAEDYVHRIGRTGRAGQTGHTVSLVMDEEYKTLKATEKRIGHSNGFVWFQPKWHANEEESYTERSPSQLFAGH